MYSKITAATTLTNPYFRIKAALSNFVAVPKMFLEFAASSLVIVSISSNF